MNDHDQTSAAARNFFAAIGAFLIGAFAFAANIQKSPDKLASQNTVTHNISVAILNEEEKRRKPSTPKKSGQKHQLGPKFNDTSSAVKPNSKALAPKYPQTHRKQGACNSFR